MAELCPTLTLPALVEVDRRRRSAACDPLQPVEQSLF
jgi:hypothetical protein